MSELKYFKIPPLPIVAVEVMKYNYSSSNAGVNDMGKIIEPDRGVCTEILKIANSGFYARPGSMTNILDAVSLLGLKSIKNLVIYISTKQLFASANSEIYEKYLHEYPITSALIARDIAIKTKRNELGDVAFLAGLLHKIGMSIFAINSIEDYESIIQEAHSAEGANLCELEQNKYETNHIELGKVAAGEWKLPEELTNLIGRGISTEERNAESELEEITVCAAWIAHEICGIRNDLTIKGITKSLPKNSPIDEDLIGYFIEEEYVNELKEHPYFQLSTG